MLFPTVDFAVFFLIVFTASWLTMPHPHVWRWFMLAASYVFYGWWDVRFVPLLALSSVGNQLLAVAIHRSTSPQRRRGLLAVAVAGNLAVLGTFKYYGFFASSLVNAFAGLGVDVPLPLLQFVLPVGISFFTFQALSYVIDVYRGDAEPAHPLDFAVYLSFFPQLVAGPIVRTSELLPQFRAPRDPRRVDIGRAFHLILLGLAKKVVIADFLAREIVDPVFHSPGQHSALETLFGVYGYSVQIFCDFSAYTDIAIGVALLLGFTLPDNFNAPYAATSIQDFWRRWHMTLSRWLRDYVYIPLGGSRGGRPSAYANLMATMLLGGLWHGAAWKFVLWGGLHGLWLAGGRWRAERAAPDPAGRPRAESHWEIADRWDPRATHGAGPARQRWTRIRGQLITFHLVTLAWIPFRADSLANTGEVIGRLVTGAWGVAGAVTPGVLLAILAGVGLQYVPDKFVARAEAGFSSMHPLTQGATLAISLLVIGALGPEGVAAFIYYQF